MKIRSSEFMGSEKQLHNPSLAVLEEVIGRSDRFDEVDIFFVSIGSGNSGRSRVGGFLSASSTETPPPEDSIYKTMKNTRHTYHRLNPGDLLADIKLDEWHKVKGSDEVVTIDRVKNATAEYLSNTAVRNSLREIAEMLVRRRRALSEDKNLVRYDGISCES